MLSKFVVGASATLLVFDALWFLRLVSCKLATYFKPKLKPLEESRVYSICTTHDIDFNFHMNNARYVIFYDVLLTRNTYLQSDWHKQLFIDFQVHSRA